MNSAFAKILLILVLTAAAAFTVSAQRGRNGTETISGSTNPATTETTQRDEDLPKTIEETLAKQRIERAKKDFAEMVERSEEAVKISADLEKSAGSANRLTSDDQKKLDRLEKLVKKIRSELGAEGDDGDKDAEATPSTLSLAIQSLQKNTSRLLDEVKKSTRYSISVVSVQTSNLLLRLVKFIRVNR